jgi:hypothetical protein
MSIAGKWQVTMETPIGTQKFTWDLQESGGTWRGTMSGQAGVSDLTDIQVVGDAVRFATVVRSPMGPLNQSFDGALNGAALSGSCATQFGNMQFRGERA